MHFYEGQNEEERSLYILLVREGPGVPKLIITDHDGDASEDVQRGQAALPPRRPLCRRCRRRRRQSRRARPAAASLDVSATLAVIGWVCCRAAIDASGEAVGALRRRCHGRSS